MQKNQTTENKPVKPPQTLTDAERSHGQRDSLLSALLAPFSFNVVAGQYMMLFAADVLNFNPLRIAAVVAFAPLVTVIRLPLLGPVRRYGRVKALYHTRLFQAGVVLLMLLIPAKYMSLTVLMGLVTLFLAARELGPNMVWHSLLRDFTTVKDRGRFFARMSFAFTAANLTLGGLIILLVGDSITEFQYKVLLIISLIGLLNCAYWVRGMPDLASRISTPDNEQARARRSLLNVLRTSPVLRMPLMVTLITMLAALPLGVIYLRQMLHVPANLVAIFIFTAMLGQALSYFLWGRLADTIGFRPMLIGLHVLAALTLPILFFVPPFPLEGIDYSNLDAAMLMGIGALLLLGFTNGILLSGIGIAVSSIQHFHVSGENSLEPLNLFTLAQMGFQSLIAYLAGIFIQEIAIPWGSVPMWNGLVHFDLYKTYAALLAPCLLLGSIVLILKLPNVRPWFGVGDFFAALMNNPTRTLMATRHVYDESEDRRAELARWFGINSNPMAIDPLVELLQDPSYEVKVEAIRSLARTGSPLAGEELLKVIKDDERRTLWDHAAWALGELEHLPAYNRLIELLDPEIPPRITAMAARALGKLQDPRAVPHLIKRLNQETQWLTVVSACCLSLLRLEARDHADQALHALDRVRNREDRYELMSKFCEWLDIPSHWLLISTSSMHSSVSLQLHIEMRSDSWREKRKNVIQAFSQRDHDKILALMEKRLKRAPDYRYPSARALAKVAAESNDWSPLSVLATAWLLYQPK